MEAQDLNLVTPREPEPQPTKAILKIGDKEVELPILRGTLGPDLIDIRALFSKANMFTYDPGFMCTASCASNICYINGEKGELLYRGYPIEKLAEHSTYMETCYLLLYGILPSKSELIRFEEIVVGEMMINEKMVEFYKGFKSDSHPMSIMVGVVGALSAFLHSDDFSNPKVRYEMAIKLIAKMPTLAAYAYRTAMGLPVVYPKKSYGYMKNFLYMMFSNPMDDHFDIEEDIMRALEVIWICHAEHEQNASTSTVRIAASSHANPYACIAAGIGSLWGPFHGGANEAVLNMLEEILAEGTTIEEVIAKAKDKNSNFRLMGFGHRVYKNFDPRATIMQKMCHNVLNLVGDSETAPLLELAINLEKKALSDEYFIKRKLYPNVDFYTGIVYKAIGIPKDMFTVLFAVSRECGLDGALVRDDELESEPDKSSAADLCGSIACGLRGDGAASEPQGLAGEVDPEVEQDDSTDETVKHDFIMLMNKFKAKINVDEFSPWEDSFQDAFKSIESSRKHKPWNSFETVEPVSKFPRRREKERHVMTRTFINISKVNLHNASIYPREELPHSESKRYMGPRISFYAQMNPNINGRSKSTLDPEKEAGESGFSAKQLTGRMVRDESIKYLQIIDQKSPNEDKRGINAYFPKLRNLQKIGVVKARKDDEQHIYLRRLKMIYSTTKKN